MSDSGGQDDLWLGRIRAAIEQMERLGGDWRQLDRLPAQDRVRLHRAIAQLSDRQPGSGRRHSRDEARQRKAARLARTEERLQDTGIRVLRSKPVFTTPNIAPPGPGGELPPAAEAPDVREPPFQGLRSCYVCRQRFADVHHFYDQMCRACGDFNFRKRTELADLSGRVALVTGARVKIGYQAGLKLLRAGAALVVTTRFPRDAATRYAAEPDFADWQHRLQIFGLDLRHTPSVEAFCHTLTRLHGRLDYIVNNACQTVRRPPQFYAHMMAAETESWNRLSAEARHLVAAYEDTRAGLSTTGASSTVLFGPARDRLAGLVRAAEQSQVALLPEDAEAPGLFPAGQLDKDLQQVDLRGRNSWRLLLDEVSSVELLEVQLVNAVAPFVLNARLKPLMTRTSGRDKHIVNVSAMEGQFYRRFKTTRHPHTNMAKAALNMMTRTSATDYHQSGIHMNSVDTGWVTDEDPVELAQRKTEEQRFHPPLDIVDGAARIVDPIIDGVNTGVHVWGKFLKDYRPTDW